MALPISLPPDVDGEVQFLLKVSISKIVWSGSFKPRVGDDVSVSFNWWGNPNAIFKLYPAFQHLGSQHEERNNPDDKRHSMKFPIKCTRQKLWEYLRDMGGLDIQTQFNNQTIGVARLGSLAQVAEFKPANGWFSIRRSEGRQGTETQIGDLQVSVVLEEASAPIPENSWNEQSIDSWSEISELNDLSAGERTGVPIIDDRHPPLSFGKAVVPADDGPAEVIDLILRRARKLQEQLNHATGNSWTVPSNIIHQTNSIPEVPIVSMVHHDMLMPIENTVVDLDNMILDDSIETHSELEGFSQDDLIIEALNPTRNSKSDKQNDNEPKKENMSTSEVLSVPKIDMHNKNKSTLTFDQISKFSRVHSFRISFKSLELQKNMLSKRPNTFIVSFQLNSTKKLGQSITGSFVSENEQKGLARNSSTNTASTINSVSINIENDAIFPFIITEDVFDELEGSKLQIWIKASTKSKPVAQVQSTTGIIWTAEASWRCMELLETDELLWSGKAPIFESSHQPIAGTKIRSRQLTKPAHVGYLKLSVEFITSLVPSPTRPLDRTQESNSPHNERNKPDMDAKSQRPVFNKPIQPLYLLLRLTTLRDVLTRASDSEPSTCLLYLKIRLLSSSNPPTLTHPIPWDQSVKDNNYILSFNYNMTVPIVLTGLLAQHSRESPLVVEVWSRTIITRSSEAQGPEAKSSQLVGLVKLPLNLLIDSVCSTLPSYSQESSVISLPSPILMPTANYPVLDPFSGQVVAWLTSFMAIGTWDQLQKRNLAHTEEVPLSQSPTKQPSPPQNVEDNIRSSKNIENKSSATIKFVVHRLCGLRGLIDSALLNIENQESHLDSKLILLHARKMGMNTSVSLEFEYSENRNRTPHGDIKFNATTPIVVRSFTPIFEFSKSLTIDSLSSGFLKWIHENGSLLGKVWHHLPHDAGGEKVQLGSFAIPLQLLLEKPGGVSQEWVKIASLNTSQESSQVQAAAQLSALFVSGFDFGAISPFGESSDGRIGWEVQLTLTGLTTTLTKNIPALVALKTVELLIHCNSTDIVDVSTDRCQVLLSQSEGKLVALKLERELSLTLGLRKEIYSDLRNFELGFMLESEGTKVFIGSTFLDLDNHITNMRRALRKGKHVTPTTFSGKFQIIDPESPDLSHSVASLQIRISHKRTGTHPNPAKQPIEKPESHSQRKEIMAVQSEVQNQSTLPSGLLLSVLVTGKLLEPSDSARLIVSFTWPFGEDGDILDEPRDIVSEEREPNDRSWDFESVLLIPKTEHVLRMLRNTRKLDFMLWKSDNMEKSGTIARVPVGHIAVDLMPLFTGYKKLSGWFPILNSVHQKVGELKVEISASENIGAALMATFGSPKTKDSPSKDQSTIWEQRLTAPIATISLQSEQDIADTSVQLQTPIETGGVAVNMAHASGTAVEVKDSSTSPLAATPEQTTPKANNSIFSANFSPRSRNATPIAQLETEFVHGLEKAMDNLASLHRTIRKQTLTTAQGSRRNSPKGKSSYLNDLLSLDQHILDTPVDAIADSFPPLLDLSESAPPQQAAFGSIGVQTINNADISSSTFSPHPSPNLNMMESFSKTPEQVPSPVVPSSNLYKSPIRFGVDDSYSDIDIGRSGGPSKKVDQVTQMHHNLATFDGWTTLSSTGRASYGNSPSDDDMANFPHESSLSAAAYPSTGALRLNLSAPTFDSKKERQRFGDTESSNSSPDYHVGLPPRPPAGMSSSDRIRRTLATMDESDGSESDLSLIVSLPKRATSNKPRTVMGGHARVVSEDVSEMEGDDYNVDDSDADVDDDDESFGPIDKRFLDGILSRRTVASVSRGRPSNNVAGEQQRKNVSTSQSNNDNDVDERIQSILERARKLVSSNNTALHQSHVSSKEPNKQAARVQPSAPTATFIAGRPPRHPEYRPPPLVPHRTEENTSKQQQFGQSVGGGNSAQTDLSERLSELRQSLFRNQPTVPPPPPPPPPEGFSSRPRLQLDPPTMSAEEIARIGRIFKGKERET